MRTIASKGVEFAKEKNEGLILSFKKEFRIKH